MESRMSEKTLIAIELDQWQVLRPLHHQWPAEVGMGLCLATWQRDTDGRMHAECPHYRYVVTDEERVHTCTCCGLTLDRDHNAACNIKRLGLQSLGVSQEAPACMPGE